jgi:RNA polymerase sigma-70 factor (ECF subfamily)
MNPERDSIEVLYSRFSNRLRQFVRSRIPDEAAADDIVQDVFLKIHDHIDTLREGDRLERWVFQVARNTVVNYYRSRKSDHPLMEEPVAIVEDNDDMHRKLASSLGEMIEQLPPLCREALKLTEIEGLRQKELAHRLGISLSAVKSRVRRARAMLRDLLMKCCHFEFDRYGTIIDYHPISCCCCKQDNSLAR